MYATPLCLSWALSPHVVCHSHSVPRDIILRSHIVHQEIPVAESFFTDK